MEEYAAFWEAPTSLDTLVVLRLQLCLALGCCLFDDALSLKPLAEQWINEVKGWLVFCERSKSDTGSLQLLCLLELCRRHYTKPSKSKSVDWICAGSLSQAAFNMGLHIDPSKLPNIPSKEAEMRRRLWRTVIELQFEAGMEAGTLPPVSPNDHSCEPPHNLDDSQLTNSDTTSLALNAKPAEVFTDTSIQLAYAQSADTRLKIIKVCNDMQTQAAYQEILQLHSELETQHRELTSRLASYGTKVSSLQRQLCDILLRRFFLTLHIPYAQLALNNNPLYQFSRTVCIDQALAVAYATTPALDNSPMLEALRNIVGASAPREEILRFTYCSNGPIRTAQGQASCVIAAELLSKLHEEASHSLPDDNVPRVGSETPRAPRTLQSLQMHALLKMGVKATQWRLRATLTTAKDYQFFTLCLAEVEAAIQGAQRDAFVRNRLLEAFEILHAAFGEAVNAPEVTVVGNFSMDSIGSSWIDDWHNFSWGDFAPRVAT